MPVMGASLPDGNAYILKGLFLVHSSVLFRSPGSVRSYVMKSADALSLSTM
jgi:hypothetical protein